MNKWLPLTFILLWALWPLSYLRGPKNPESGLPLREFGSLPVINKGRHQPLDSLARNSLVILRGKQTLNLEPWKGNFDGPKIITATEWLMELMFTPETADTRPCFRVDNDNVKGLLDLPMFPDAAAKADGKHFSWSQISPKLPALQRETMRAARIKVDLRNAYERSLMDLSEATGIYQMLRASITPCLNPDFKAGLAAYRDKLTQAQKAWGDRSDGLEVDESILNWVQLEFNAPLIVPPHPGVDNKLTEWQNCLQEIRNTPPTAEPDRSLASYAAMAAAYKSGNMAGMTTAINEYREWLASTKRIDADLKKGPREQLFNYVEVFYKAMVLSVLAMLLGLAVWFAPAKLEVLRKIAVGLMVLVVLLLTGGILTRMILEGRPPVTNLYSSALFIGWAACLFGLVLEKIWPYCIGVMVSALIGFCTLLVAHFLSLSGDTMVMLQAVLDTNFWLATHVVIVTLGYASTYVAGILGVFYVIRSLLDRTAQERLGKMFSSMVFGILCFAVLFSFVGTVLGGIWADQSWGRFWGWDPKENGALVIVLWNALALHARLGGMVKERGMMLLAIVGNMVTSWSWFGVNMLGIGLHSYGFINAASYALWSFIGFNLLLIILALCFLRSRKVSAKPKAPADALPA